jgi:hypothetical protein
MPRHKGTPGVTLPPPLVEFVRTHRDTPTLSVFVAGGMADPADRAHWHVTLRRQLSQRKRAIAKRPKPERESYATCVERLVERLPDDATMHAVRGWACFVSADGEVLALPLEFAPDPGVVWQAGPRIAPCLAAIPRAAAIVAVVDRQHATLSRWSADGLSPLEMIESTIEGEPGTHMGNAPRRGFHAGTRGEAQRDAAARRLREAAARHAHAAADRIAAHAAADLDIALGGPADAVAAVIAGLPASCGLRVTRMTGVRAVSNAAVVHRAAEAALAALDGERQAALVAALLDDAGATGHAVGGVVDVIRALEQRAVDHLVMSPSVLSWQPEAADRIVYEALLERAEIEIARDKTALLLDRAAEGIVARLRFAVPHARMARARTAPGRRRRADAVVPT